MTNLAMGSQATSWEDISKETAGNYSVDDFGKDIDHQEVSTSPGDLLHARLDEIAALPDDWNGYGAVAPSPEIIRIASAAVDAFDHKGCLPTKIMPGVANDVAMLWERTSYRALLEISMDSWDWSIAYHGVDRPDDYHEAEGEVNACADKVRASMLAAEA